MQTPVFNKLTDDGNQVAVVWSEPESDYPIVAYELFWNRGIDSLGATEKLTGGK